MRMRRGFSLVELVVVIVIIGIITIFALLAGTSGDSVDAQVEAKKIVRTINALRSAWLAYYSEKYEMLGVTNYSYSNSISHDMLLGSLDHYAGGDLLHSVPEYGRVDISVDASGGAPRYFIGLFIGQTSPTSSDHQKAVRALLASDNFVQSYNLVAISRDKGGVSGDSVMIRVK